MTPRNPPEARRRRSAKPQTPCYLGAAMAESKRIVEVLGGGVEVGAAVVVEGWVRTRRDSKAGLSFVNVHDGSCFAPIQLVVPGTLDNYESEVLHLTSGCAVRRSSS